jgi:hypothetical protein
MKTNLLIEFIDKYSVNGTINMVNWKVVASEKTLRTRGELDSKTFIADVTLKDFNDISEDVRIPIANTSKVRMMLSPFKEEVKISVNKDNDRVKGFSLLNSDCECYCTAAEPSAIPPVTKNIQDDYAYDVEIALTPDFVSSFLKARAALDEVDEFTIKMSPKNQVEVVLGYSVANTNRINLVAPTINGKDSFNGLPIKFPSKNFVEILKANKNIDSGVLYLRPMGVIKVIYNTPQFHCLYYQFASLKK